MKLNITIYIIFFHFIVSAQKTNSIDKIVGQIGDNIILQSDIESQKLQLIQENKQIGIQSDCSILEDLLFQNLLLNQAELDSIKITDAQVDGEMENRIRVIENQIGGRQKMEEFYGKTITQIKNEFRPLIRKRLMSEEMQRQITSSASVTPKEIESFYNKLPVDSIPLINTKLSFQQIVVFPKITQDDKQLTINKLKEIREEIIKGKSFETQARLHSQDPGSASQGGKIKASRGMMVPQFESTAFSLKEGEISNVFETDYGYHIIQLLERKGDDYTCRHILMIPEFNRQSLSEASTKMEECFQKLKQNQTTWDEAVLAYSNDVNTKQNKGIITNPITGEQSWSSEDLNQIDQQIFLLTNALNKGDLTQPSLYFDFNEKKQGIRIVRLMNRTSPHRANLKEDYALIQRATEASKKEEILSKWVIDKIGNAFIKIDSNLSECKFKYPWLNTIK
jgi:peptidyl-prolyl cis-trans isomerase SurA